jgi:predicted transcriptional regulator
MKSGWSGKIGIDAEEIKEKIGIPQQEYLDRIVRLEKMKLLYLSGSVATITSEGRLALQEQKEADQEKGRGR